MITERSVFYYAKQLELSLAISGYSRISRTDKACPNPCI
ncbi:unnamed protein product [Brugia timori]|uniref:HTH luxR-type domain-containing protein n=1 Tax=Brugia timori TaxID=42155 RepID=A0A0R3R3P3_9BILA|nr:unnamed protein product [Brugia timori]